MIISVILGHPSSGSFNHAIADAVVASLKVNNHEVRFHDLYAERFDPLLLSTEMPKHSAQLHATLGERI
jgi:NAD(P)H dehydrogenase (quinone)